MTDEVTLLVSPGAELPKIGAPMKVSSVLSDTDYKFVPKKITALRWNKQGDLIVELSGVKQPWNAG